MTDLNSIEERLAAIEQRNAKVTLDKTWERSVTRRLAFALFTYVIAAVYLVLINAKHPFGTAAVPAVGYLLSMLSLQGIRSRWEQRAR